MIDIKQYKSATAASNEEKSERNPHTILDFLNRDIKLLPNQFGDKKKERFFTDLYILISSGIDMRSALELLEEDANKSKEQQLIQQIKEDIIKGSSLWESMKKSGKFTSYEYYSIQIGEESASLAKVIKELATYFTDRIRLKRQIISAISYPILVLIVAFGTTFVMLNYMVPMFADMLKQNGSELPALTQFIIHISNGLKENLWIIGCCILTFILIFYQIRNNNTYRKIQSQLVLSIPVIGKLIRNIHLARLTTALSLLISARTPLVRSIELVQQMIHFYPIQFSLASLQEELMQGKQLYECLREYTIYDKRMITLIKVGESVNQLDHTFKNLSQQYTDEVDYTASILKSFLEPVLLLILGLIVGTIVIAMYLPLLELNSSI